MLNDTRGVAVVVSKWWVDTDTMKEGRWGWSVGRVRVHPWLVTRAGPAERGICNEVQAGPCPRGQRVRACVRACVASRPSRSTLIHMLQLHTPLRNLQSTPRPPK